jgi:Putative auto-transporter adhesin, head GIN domain
LAYPYQKTHDLEKIKNIKMKPTILTLALALTALIGVSNTTYAAVNGKEAVTILNQATPVSRIEVHGNVELYVSNGPADQVKVYNNYYAENAVVQGQDGVLRIASYGDQKLVIWVSSACLQKISAYDNAVVKSFGKLSAIELDVNLFDNASAQLNIDTYALNLKLHGRAKADLSGSTSVATLNSDYSCTLNYAMLDLKQLDKNVNLSETKSIVAIP